MLAKVKKAGGKEPKETMDIGWMYSRTFTDLDSHQWEVLYMDMKAFEKNFKMQMKNTQKQKNRK
jgi:predicted lactoylglutathione lyase